VVIRVIRKSNDYIDSQLIQTYEEMVSAANVKMYKSNQKAWVDNQFRYNQESENEKFYLEYRIVCHRVGGINKETMFSYNTGLQERARCFIQDLLTVANTLGFTCETSPESLEPQATKGWKSGENVSFSFVRDGKTDTLFDVKAFFNGNLHIRFNQQFMLALNVEYGRLKGWLNSGETAAEELGNKKSKEYFSSISKIELIDSGFLLN
jgi:hypothetical protein